MDLGGPPAAKKEGKKKGKKVPDPRAERLGRRNKFLYSASPAGPFVVPKMCDAEHNN